MTNASEKLQRSHPSSQRNTQQTLLLFLHLFHNALQSENARRVRYGKTKQQTIGCPHMGVSPIQSPAACFPYMPNCHRSLVSNLERRGWKTLTAPIRQGAAHERKFRLQRPKIPLSCGLNVGQTSSGLTAQDVSVSHRTTLDSKNIREHQGERQEQKQLNALKRAPLPHDGR